MKHRYTCEEIIQAFQMFDTNHDGTVSALQLEHAMKHLMGLSDEETSQIIKEASEFGGAERIDYTSFAKHLFSY